MKDIFIDTNIVKNFTNPMDKAYKDLIAWLQSNQIDKPEENAVLVLSPKLYAEYLRTIQATTYGNTNIHAIIFQLQKEGRINRIENEQIKQFKQAYFKPKIVKNFKSNIEDREHIPVVLLSQRKLAISIDENFKKDIEEFPHFQAKVSKRPEKTFYM